MDVNQGRSQLKGRILSASEILLVLVTTKLEASLRKLKCRKSWIMCVPLYFLRSNSPESVLETLERFSPGSRISHYRLRQIWSPCYTSCRLPGPLRISFATRPIATTQKRWRCCCRGFIGEGVGRGCGWEGAQRIGLSGYRRLGPNERSARRLCRTGSSQGLLC